MTSTGKLALLFHIRSRTIYYIYACCTCKSGLKKKKKTNEQNSKEQYIIRTLGILRDFGGTLMT